MSTDNMQIIRTMSMDALRKEINSSTMVDDLPNKMKTVNATNEHPRRKLKRIIHQLKKDIYGDVGRNDPCSCGSGIKYKKCHLTKSR